MKQGLGHVADGWAWKQNTRVYWNTLIQNNNNNNNNNNKYFSEVLMGSRMESWRYNHYIWCGRYITSQFMTPIHGGIDVTSLLYF